MYMTNRIGNLLGSGEVITESMIHNWIQDQVIIYGKGEDTDEIEILKELIRSIENSNSLEIYLSDSEQFDPSLVDGLEVPENISSVDSFKLHIIHILNERLKRIEN
jgi:hypothetical protein